MPVNGQELATLDFGNLIGGPLSAVVEAQAKSSMRTADFIREVAFDKDGKLLTVDFVYNRRNDDTNTDEEFTLTVPFLTMLPVPYIQIDEAIIEFNAKITSITQQGTMSELKNRTDASAGGSWWFARAAITSKTSYQRTSASSDKEERTFDMRVYVKARGTDMPSGTERLLTILENVITERKGGSTSSLLGLQPAKKETLGAAATDASKEVTFNRSISAAKVGWGLFEASGGAVKGWITDITAGSKATVLNATGAAFDIVPERTYSIKPITELQNVKVPADKPIVANTDIEIEFTTPVISADVGWKLRPDGNATEVLGTVVTRATKAAPTKLKIKPAKDATLMAAQQFDLMST